MLAELESASRDLGARARGATVALRSGDRRSRSSGSGIRLDRHIVATCAHCLREPRASVEIGERTYDARVEHFDASADVAILRLAEAPEPASPLEVRDAASLRPGELVFAFGHPLGARDVLAHGVVRRANARLVVSDVPLAPGNSGGPLFDAAGRLVGMNSAIARGRSFSVATETIERVRSGAGERRLGVTVAPGRAHLRGGVAVRAFVVTGVETGSDAQRSGIALGDAIVAIDGRPLGADGASALRAATHVTLLRDGAVRDLTLARRRDGSSAAA